MELEDIVQQLNDSIKDANSPKSTEAQLVEWLHINHTVQDILLQAMVQIVDTYPVTFKECVSALNNSLYWSIDSAREMRIKLEEQNNGA